MTATQPSVPRATAPHPVPARMRAVVQDRYGDADALRFDDVPTPTPGAGEVLLEVHAAGVNRGTWHLMTGLPHLMRVMGFGLRRPARRVPGTDLAGRVVALGEGVDTLQVVVGVPERHGLGTGDAHRPLRVPVVERAGERDDTDPRHRRLRCARVISGSPPTRPRRARRAGPRS